MVRCVEDQPGLAAWQANRLGEKLDLSLGLGHCVLVDGWIHHWWRGLQEHQIIGAPDGLIWDLEPGLELRQEHAQDLELNLLAKLCWLQVLLTKCLPQRCGSLGHVLLAGLQTHVQTGRTWLHGFFVFHIDAGD